MVFSSALRDASNAEAQVTTATRRVSNAVETDRARHAKPPSAKCAMKRDAAARETRSEGSGRRASERERRRWRATRMTRDADDTRLTPFHVRPRPQNRRNTSERLELMKYNPYLRRHTLHRELKK